MIGDSLDDAAARAVGAFAVLHTGGLHSAKRLTAPGVPLVDCLEDAVATGIATLTHHLSHRRAVTPITSIGGCGAPSTAAPGTPA